MPNIGKPSGGCYSCRRMRVKCDERRPGCLRCERGARKCPGYREEPLVFRSMNATSESLALFPRPRRKPKSAASSPQPASAKKEELRRSRSPPRRASTSNTGSRSPVISPKRRSSASPLKDGQLSVTPPTASLSASWEDVAVNYYLSSFIIVAGDDRKTLGYFDCLPTLLSENIGAAHLEMALKSVALSALGNRSSMEQLKVQARQSYGQALSQVNFALNDFAMAKADATIAALILLGQYEIISGDRPGHSLWMSHGEGQAVLLGLRGTVSLEEDRSRQLFRIAQLGLQMSNVANQSSRKPWRNEPPAVLFPDHLSRRFYDFNEAAFNTHRDTATLLRDAWRDETWHENLRTVTLRQKELLDEAEQITKDCQERSMFWSAPSQDTANQTESGGSHQTDPPSHLPSYIYLFTDIVTASNLIYFWALRTKLLDELLASTSLLENAQYPLSPPVHSMALHAQLRTSIDDMCASIPFALGELDANGALTVAGAGTSVGAYNVLWPLHVLCSVRELDAVRREWVLARLAQIGAVFGIRQASLLQEYWIQRPLGPAPHKVNEVNEANAGPGSVWFPIL